MAEAPSRNYGSDNDANERTTPPPPFPGNNYVSSKFYDDDDKEEEMAPINSRHTTKTFAGHGYERHKKSGPLPTPSTIYQFDHHAPNNITPVMRIRHRGHDDDGDGYNRYHAEVQYHREHFRRHSEDSGVLCWAFLTIAAFLTFFVLLAVLGTTRGTKSRGHAYHSDGSYHPHGRYPGYPARQDDPTLRKKEGCATGEQWNVELQLCVTKTLVPSSVDDDIKDPTVSPCDDFEKYACGKWDADPAHLDETRGFTSIARLNERQVSAIVRDPSVKGVHAFYRSCVETVVQGKHRRINAQERVRESTVILGEFNSMGDLPEVFALLMRNAFTAPLAIQIENHPKRNKAIPLIRYDAFPVMTEREIREIYEGAGDDVRMAILKSRKLLTLLKRVQAEEHVPPDIDNYLHYLKSGALERDIMSWSQFKKMAFGGQFAWDRLLMKLDGHNLRFEDNQEVWVLGRDYFKWFDARSLMTHQEWRLYCEFSITYHTSNFFPDLPAPSYFRVHHPLRRFARHHARLRRFKSRRKEPRDGPHAPDDVVTPTEYDCVRATQVLLPGLVSKEFLERNPKMVDAFPDVTRMVERVRDEYTTMIEASPYISDETKAATARKYQSIIVRVGHPTEWHRENFADRLRSDHFIHNLDVIREYRVQRELELWREGGVLDRDAATRFGSPLSVVNAFYQPSSNTISILPGILRYPFYHPRMDDPSKYAGIGMVAGHELGHAADPHGIEFDELGNLRQWWTPEEKSVLEKRYACLVAEYTAPVDCINSGDQQQEQEEYGHHTLGENVADKMGLDAARRAMLKNGPGQADSSPAQRAAKSQFFFLAYAQTWCSSYSREKMCQRVKNDVHALQFDRVNKPLRNMPAFKSAWGCRVGSGMVNENSCEIFG